MGIAIASVVSSAAVAIAVPFITARLARRQMAHQANEARLDELRSVLSMSAIAFTRARNALAEVEVSLPDAGRGKRDTSEAELAVTKLYESMASVHEHQDRLAIRLGIDARLSDLYREMVDVLGTRSGIATDGVSPGEPTAAEADKQADTLQVEFYEEASSLVGPDLSL